jgi:hypothetical protein
LTRLAFAAMASCSSSWTCLSISAVSRPISSSFSVRACWLSPGPSWSLASSKEDSWVSRPGRGEGRLLKRLFLAWRGPLLVSRTRAGGVAGTVETSGGKTCSGRMTGPEEVGSEPLGVSKKSWDSADFVQRRMGLLAARKSTALTVMMRTMYNWLGRRLEMTMDVLECETWAIMEPFSWIS